MNRLVLLSGWGCDARIWQPLASHWPSDLTVTAPDWPGYNARPALSDPADLAALAAAMAPDLPADAVWVGWSLGGLLAAALLDHLPPPRALVMLGMGPRFCHEEGVSSRELAAFRRAFDRDDASTHRHFLRWQLGGEPSPLQAHRHLQALLGETHADRTTLAAGLGQLAHLDVTARLADPPCPVWRLAGARDPLIAPAWRVEADHILSQAGHCPMLSQPEALAACLSTIAREPGSVPLIDAENAP